MKDPTLYVPVHAGLFSHRKLGRLSSRLGISDVLAVGHLVALWTSALQQTTDGVLRRWDEIDIARSARWTGKPGDLLDALIAEEWIERAGEADDDTTIPAGTLMVRGWEDYAGRGMQYRENEKKRKAEARAAKKASTSAPVPPLSADKPALSADVPRQRNETDRNETKLTEDLQREGSPASPPPTHLRPVVVVEAPEPPPQTLEERAEQARASTIVKGVVRDQRAARHARSGAVNGRPQDGRALLAMPVVVGEDGVVVRAGEMSIGTPLGEIWAKRFPSLDGKGSPRRESIAEVVARIWGSSEAWTWTLDAAAYLARWGGILADIAGKARYAWERDGGTAGVVDPDRAAAKRKYTELQGLGRDLPPFDTWFVERWKTGSAEATTPSTPPGSGSRPVGPRSGAAPVHGGDVERLTAQAMAGLSDSAGAAGLAALKARVLKPRGAVGDDVDLGTEVQS